MKTIGISGGTGFVGRHLSRMLEASGYRIMVLSRGSKPSRGNIRYAHWDPAAKEIDAASLQDLDAVVHLAGAGVVDKRWTEARKAEIISSRVDTTAFLLEQLQRHAPLCRTFIAASATGIYGPDRGGPAFREDDPPYQDFLGQVCVQWEAAALAAKDRYRTVIFRFGIVLGPDGGAFPELSGPMKFGIMPVLGSGDQVVPWIHVADVAGMILKALENRQYAGIYNAVAPNPVTHRSLMQAIARAKGGLKIPAPVPPFVLKIILGEASIEVLKSCTASSAKVLEAGYVFRYPAIDAAAKAITDGGIT